MTTKSIYIVSTGRAGSTFLYKFFQKYYPEFEITHQTKWSRIINIIGNLPFGHTFKCWSLRKSFKHFKKQDLPNTTLDPLLSFPISELLRTKPAQEVKIIHLVRHPQDFANSFMRWKSSSLRKMILHYLIPFWQPVALFNGVGFIKSLQMSKYEKFCWIWNFKNAKFNLLNKDYDYLLIKMELLIRPDSQDVWHKLIDFVALPQKEIDYNSFVSNRINKSNNNKATKEKHTVEKQKTLCQRYCGGLANTLGYKI
ncbi:hypothetical protein ES708_29940 [subsurface metagenome]